MDGVSGGVAHAAHGGAERPCITIVIPTVGRPTLEATVASIRAQVAWPVAEVLLVVDTHPAVTADWARVQAVAERYTCRVTAHAGAAPCWGHPQRNAGQAQAQGTWLAFLQDDDCWAPGAWSAMQASIHRAPWAPRLFRTDTWQAGVVWRTPELVEGNIDANCIVTPNVPERLGRWTERYAGDFDFIAETCAYWEQVIWEPTVIAIGRPHQR